MMRKPTRAMKRKADAVLMPYQLKINYTGYWFIVSAVLELSEHIDKCMNMQKLYEEIGKVYGTTGKNVHERMTRTLRQAGIDKKLSCFLIEVSDKL